MGLSTGEVDNSARPILVMDRSFFYLMIYLIDVQRGNQVSQDLSMALSTIRGDKTVIPGHMVFFGRAGSRTISDRCA